jgi:hypothetical protein
MFCWWFTDCQTDERQVPACLRHPATHVSCDVYPSSVEPVHLSNRCVQCRVIHFERSGGWAFNRDGRRGGRRSVIRADLPETKNVVKVYGRPKMTVASNMRVTVRGDIKINGQSGHAGGSRTARRTNAKFLLACGIQLLTLVVMCTRAVWNQSFSALSAYTALLPPDSKSAQSHKSSGE